MIPFLKLLGVTSIQMSPFCKDFTTIVELKETYVLYCPRTFTYDEFVGMEDEEDIEHVEDDGDEQAKETHVAAKIKSLRIKHLQMRAMVKLMRAIRIIRLPMRARWIMTRRMVMVLMLYCPVLPKGKKDWILH